jgi:hypothetical protein
MTPVDEHTEGENRQVIAEPEQMSGPESIQTAV